jgi:NAD(P)-dependent dehydrogenase (short-subunit alcohol dehydrogenase family)
MRLDGKVGIVVGAGQSRDETVGTGRAAAIVFAREGAKVMLADRDLELRARDGRDDRPRGRRRRMRGRGLDQGGRLQDDRDCLPRSLGTDFCTPTRRDSSPARFDRSTEGSSPASVASIADLIRSMRTTQIDQCLGAGAAAFAG